METSCKAQHPAVNTVGKCQATGQERGEVSCASENFFPVYGKRSRRKGGFGHNPRFFEHVLEGGLRPEGS